MSRNGSGTYSLPAGNPVVTGTTISSTWANNTLTDIATALTGSLAADGQTTATGNLKMGSNRITGLADGLAATDAATVNQIPSSALFLLKASNLSDVADVATSRTNLGLGSIATQNSNAVSITGGTITGITDLAVADGGTGSSTLSANAVLLGNGTSALQTVAPSTTGNVLTSNGTTWVSSAPATVSSSQLAQAWVAYNATTTTILASYNVSSVTLNSTGKQTVNFTTAFSDANYCIAGSQAVNAGSGQTGIGIGDTGTSGTNPTTTACQIYTANVGGGYSNSTRMSAVFYR